MKFAVRYKMADALTGYQIYPGLSYIEEETTNILQGVPTDRAVSIALAATMETPVKRDVHIPAVVIFSREGGNPEEIWKKLLTVLKTPDYDTPSYRPEVRPLIDALKSTLFRSGYAEGIVGAIASAHMVRVAGGDSVAINWTYEDMARRYPQYASEWYETLESQFGGQVLPNKHGSQVGRELDDILQRNIEIARIYERSHNKRLQGEDLLRFMVRQLKDAGEIFDISDEEGFGKAVAVLDRVWRDYRRETYDLRGIPYEY